MNERIKELAEQAFQPINDISTEGVADRYTFEQAWFQVYNQKFAELVVQECLGQIYSVTMDNPTDDWDQGYDSGLHQAAETIKQHFEIDGEEDIDETCPRCGDMWSGTSCGIPDCGWVTGS